MPDKNNENRIMSMLERMGMVRRVDSDDEQASESEPLSTRSPRRERNNLTEDFFSDTAEQEEDPFKKEEVSSVGYQPVPGLSSPVLPPEKPQKPVVEAEPQPQSPPQPQRKTSARRNPSGRDYTFDQSFWDEPSDSNALPIEAYTDRFLEIDEIYEVLSLQSGGTDTIYLIEKYLNSLPDSLPDDSRREIISKIISASGFDYDQLRGDGISRVGKLKEYAEQFARRTEEYVATRNAELEGLEQQIQKVRNMIDRRKELHKKQFFSIEAEAQRLKEILSFISE